MDATQELLSLGAGNLLCSFLSGMPVTGSFTRSSINSSSGVRSTGAGIFASATVLLALGFLMPAFAYIPRASLAAVIICAMIVGIDIAKARDIWRASSNKFTLQFTEVSFLFFYYALHTRIGHDPLSGYIIRLPFLEAGVWPFGGGRTSLTLAGSKHL